MPLTASGGVAESYWPTRSKECSTVSRGTDAKREFGWLKERRNESAATFRESLGVSALEVVNL
jgi:hypothetical protein